MKNEIKRSIEGIAAHPNISIGNDLVFVPDFKDLFNDLFKKKVFTVNEIAYCQQFDDSILRYASTWAAKEAVYKAIKQLDASTLGWNKIEIIRQKNAGQPQVHIHKEQVEFKISLTISHDGDYAWAIALVNRN